MPILPPVNPSFYKNAAWICGIPFLLIFISYHQANPFLLSGPHFLLFFQFFSAAILAITLLHKYYRKQDYTQIAAHMLPADANPYQLAAFLFGKNRAVQTAIINLMNRDLLALNENGNFRIKRRNTSYHPLLVEANPLMDGWEKEPDYLDVPYRRIVDQWYNPGKTVHPTLQVLEQFVFREKIIYWIPYVLIVLVGIARCIQGLINDRPVGFLTGEMAFATLIYWLALRLIPGGKKVIFDKAVRRYDCNDIPMLYALKGPTTIRHFADAALLTAAFGASITEIYRQGDREILPDDKSGSSCSSGGSCCSGGGSSCGGGGGCGGCSGD